MDVSTLAKRLGIGVRHLDRLFQEQLEASPLQVAKTHRIQRAKRMLNETADSLERIARTSGFKNARGMTRAFTGLYGRPPSTLRDTAGQV